MTHEEFVQMIERALDKHVSRDPTICDKDQKWEARNLANRVSYLLRAEGINMPEYFNLIRKGAA